MKRVLAYLYMLTPGILCLYSLPSNALDIIASVNYGPEFTSNTAKTESDEIEELIHVPGFELDLKHQSDSLQLDANYSYESRIYEKDIWEDENISTGGGSARWQVVSNRLDFFISNVRTLSTVRAIQAETPANRQVQSTNQAGSSLTFKPRGKDLLRFEYAYVDISTSENLAESTRQNGTLNYNIGLSSTSQLQIAATYSDIEYSGAFPDAETTIATVGYTNFTDNLEVDIKIGHNWYERDDRGKSDDGTYEILLTWHISPDTSLEFDAFRGIVDQSNNLTSSPGDGSVGENTGINAAFVETRGELTLSQIFGRTTLSLNGYWTEQEYADDVPLDSDRYGFSMNVSRNLTPRTTFSFSVDYEQRDFTARSDEQEQIGANFNVSHQIGTSLDFNWGVSYEDRRSETTLSYEETIVRLEIRYTFVGSR